MTSAAQASFQPQSQTSRRGGDLRLRMGDGRSRMAVVNRAWRLRPRIPSKIAAFTSAITAAGARGPQRGQALPLPCDQQLVRFSEAVMVKKPPSSGTARPIDATESVRNCRTAGTLVQSAA